MKLRLGEVPRCCHGCVHLKLINIDTHFCAEFECYYGSLVIAYLYGMCKVKLNETSIVEVKEES